MKKTTDTRQALPENVLLQLAELADVQPHNRDEFCELISDSVLKLWNLDRRAVFSKPDTALLEAAKATRTLHQAFHDLNKEDREWLEHIKTSLPLFTAGEIHELKVTIENIAILFSIAVGRSAPPTRLTPNCSRR